jgi:hypothetical protein
LSVIWIISRRTANVTSLVFLAVSATERDGAGQEMVRVQQCEQSTAVRVCEQNKHAEKTRNSRGAARTDDETTARRQTAESHHYTGMRHGTPSKDSPDRPMRRSM